jgi:hypothetical protein
MRELGAQLRASARLGTGRTVKENHKTLIGKESIIFFTTFLIKADNFE